MKKFIISCILLLCIALFGCSSGDKNKIPDDLVVVLPDGKEIYLYMSHDDAAEVLGPSDEVKDFDGRGSQYVYDDLKLWVMYTDGLLTYINLQPDTSCKLKSGLSPSSKKSDFVSAGFDDGDAAEKYYAIDNGKYSNIKDRPSSYEFGTTVTVSSNLLYKAADKPKFKGFPISVSDLYCSMWLKYDK